MNTVLQDLIQWTNNYSFNIEDDFGVNYVVIDHEEMSLKFAEWLEKEREQITSAVKYGFNDATSVSSDISFNSYYDDTFI